MFGPFLSFLKALSVYAYPLLFAGSCFEVLVPVAIFVPGELFFYAGGILSAAGFLSIWLTLIACIAGGYVGDICSFYIGKRYAARMERALESWRIFHDVYGREFMAEHGDRAVFLARFPWACRLGDAFFCRVFRHAVQTILDAGSHSTA